MATRKKLIEVALPLEAINKASIREKSIRHGHPSTIHLWWSRKPLAACRAVLFASLVDDPSANPDRFPDEESQDVERQRLFSLMEALVEWEKSNDPQVLAAAQAEIEESTNGNPPPVLDPFCGGGSIPVEAQRLGLAAYGSDLNPVAVLITKALIEIPPKFEGKPPVHPTMRARLLPNEWHRVQGLAADIRFYGKWMRDEASQRIGHVYPKMQLPKERGGGEATAIAWLWARAVTCPNPACGAQMPLASKWSLSTKPGKVTWVAPIVDFATKTIRFDVRVGNPDSVTAHAIATGSCVVNEKGKKVKATFRCLTCEVGIAKGEYIDREANSGRLGLMPVAVVTEGARGRVFLPISDNHRQAAVKLVNDLLSMPLLSEKLPSEPARGTFASNAQGRSYGFRTFTDYFTPRQLLALVTFSDLALEAHERVQRDALKNGLPDDEVALDSGGMGARAYADAVVTYLALAMDRLVDRNSSLCTWDSSRETIGHTFTRQAIAMNWDVAEANPFSTSTGNFQSAIEWVAEAIESSSYKAVGIANQLDATASINMTSRPLISTDPPYYDNVSYADLADFFYVWLRRTLGRFYPKLFSTLLVPKSQELIATPYRFSGNKERAKQFFEKGLGEAFSRMLAVQHPDYPLTLYYAFKQAESDSSTRVEGESLPVLTSTGWETMLEGLLASGFTITGTWPIRTELSNRTGAMGANSLASSIVLVCRPRANNAATATRREFLNALKRELPMALRNLQHGNIAPVDLAQAAIGPGMAIFSRYTKVVESDGSPMRVRTALQLINQSLDQVLAEHEGAYDADTRWAIAWFEQYAHEEGPYGVAETLSTAKDTAVAGLVAAGILSSRSGKVRLLRRDELAVDWDPTTDQRLTVWEITQHLIRALDQQGEIGAGVLLRRVGGMGDVVRDLAYRLYTTCERKGWTQEAIAYNSLVVAWPELSRLASQPVADEQTTFLR